MNNTERAMKELQEYIEKLGDKVNKDNINDYTQQFIREYNRKITLEKAGQIEKSDEDKAHDLFEEALETYNPTRAKKLLKNALELYPDFLDAKAELASYTSNTQKRFKEYEKLENEERKNLEEQGFFDEDAIGSFYGILETRPYIRLLFRTATEYREMCAYRKAMEVYERIIELNENDNTGSRFELMGIYTTLEEIEKMDTIMKKYPGDTVPGLLFQFVLAYKTLDFTNAKKHIKKLYKFVPKIKDLLLDELDEEDFISDAPPGYYSPYSLEEVMMYMHGYPNLFLDDEMLDFIVKTLR